MHRRIAMCPAPSRVSVASLSSIAMLAVLGTSACESCTAEAPANALLVSTVGGLHDGDSPLHLEYTLLPRRGEVELFELDCERTPTTLECVVTQSTD